MQKLNEFYDYPVTGYWEYMPETMMSAPHPQPCPTDGSCYRSVKIDGRYKMKVMFWDGSVDCPAENCMVLNQEFITDLEPIKWLLNFDITTHLAAYNASRPSTIPALTLKNMKMKISAEKLNDFE